MRQVGRYIIALLAFAGSSGVDPSFAQSGCGPAPAELQNPPEMKRVPGRLQSIDLEARQDGERLCFVDRNSRDRPGIAPTIRVRPGETLRVRLFNRIENAWALRMFTPPIHPTAFPRGPDMPVA